MTFAEYQTLSRKTVIYPNPGNNLVYTTLGLVGEAGEVAEKMKKVIRDGEGVLDETRRQEIGKELGDVLWYLAQLATELNMPLEGIAATNLRKLNSRKDRGALKGDGDER